jgi:hypothetical protein
MRDGGEFTEDDEAVLVALGAAAGVAVENAQLYDAARRQQRWTWLAPRSPWPGRGKGPRSLASSPDGPLVGNPAYLASVVKVRRQLQH